MQAPLIERGHLDVGDDTPVAVEQHQQFAQVVAQQDRGIVTGQPKLDLASFSTGLQLSDHRIQPFSRRRHQFREGVGRRANPDVRRVIEKLEARGHR